MPSYVSLAGDGNMWRGYVESDSGEQLRIIRADGTFGGKALLAFLRTFTNYLQHTDQEKEQLAEEINWFETLSQAAKQPLQDLLAPIEHAHYVGDWGDYGIDEWEFFIRRNKININQLEFEKALETIHEKWTLINKLHKSVSCLREILESNNPQPTIWYQPEETIPDLQGLQLALDLLKERHAKVVRIKFLV